MATLRLAIDARKSRDGADQHNKAVDEVKRKSKDARDSVNRLDRQTSSLGRTFRRVATGALALAGGFTAVAAIQDVVSTAADYEETMSAVLAVTQATDTEFLQLSNTARELGSSTRFSASEAGEGLLFLSRAGFSVQESIGALPATLDLATAAQLGLGEASDIASNVLAQFRLEAVETSRAADVLLNTANSANTDVRQLAEGLKIVGPVAGAVGQSLEEVSSALGVLGDSGIQASLAGTNLRGIISSLLAPTAQAQETLASLGITVSELDPASRSLSDIFERLAESNLTAADAIAIFDRRNAAAALTLTAGAEKVRELTSANQEAGGAAAETARIMNDNLRGAVRSLRSATEELFLQMGEAGLLQVLRVTVEVLTDVIRLIGGAEEETLKYARTAQALEAALYGVVAAGTALVAINLVGYLSSASAAMGSLLVAIRAGTTALLASLGPVGLAVAAVGAIVTALTLVKDETLEVEGVTVRVADVVGALISNLADRVKLFIDATVFGVKAIFELIGPLIDQGLELIDTNLNDFLGNYVDNFKAGFDTILEISSLVVNTIIRTVVAAGESLGVLAARAIEVVMALADVDVFDPSSFAKAKDRIAAALSPGQTIADIQQAWTDTFKRDFVDEFVGELDVFANFIAEEYKGYLEVALQDPEFAEIYRRFQELGGFNLNNSIDAVLEEAKKRAQSRIDSEVEETTPTSDDPLQDVLETLKLIGEESDRAAVNVASQTEKTLEAARIELEILKATQSNQEDARAIAEFQIQALQDYGEQQELVNEKVEEYTELLEAAGAEAARLELAELNQEIKNEIDLIGRSSDARERAIRLTEFQALAERQFGEGTEAAAMAVAEYLELLEELETKSDLRTLAEGIGSSFADAFSDIILGAADAEDAIKSLYQEVIRLAAQQFITDPAADLVSDFATNFASSLSGAFSRQAANGGVVRNGNLTMFGRGGVVDQPMSFPMANGGTGMVGEIPGSKEGILPLAEVNGVLGVNAAGMGAGRNTTVNMYVQTPDVGGFKRTDRQLYRRALRATRG